MPIKKTNPLLFVFIGVICCTDAWSQEKDTTVKIDLLRAPSSPASTLLGISASDIEKPTDVTSFMASIKNATNNFTALPTNYAIDFAPFQLFNKTRVLDSKSLVENRENFARSFVVSLGVKKVDKNEDVPETKPKMEFGFGVKFALKRGEIDNKSKNVFKAIWMKQQILNRVKAEKFKLYKETDTVMIRLEKELASLPAAWQKNKITEDSMKVRMGEIIQEINARDAAYKINLESEMSKAIKIDISNEVKKIKLERQGFNLDFAAGTVIDFLDNKFDEARVFKVGGWLTGGWTNSDKSSSALFILRYLYNPKTALADPELNLENLHTLDFGGRAILTGMEKKLLMSGEVIYRSILNEANANSSFRIMLNAEYEIGINQRLTFSFGRNFDGTTYKSGNVIGALNLLLGFGGASVNSQTLQQ